MNKIEYLVLRSLLHNEEYLRKALPFLKSEYFEDENQRIVYEEITNFVTEYNELPTKEVLSIEVEKRKDINEDMFRKIAHLISTLDEEPAEFEWLPRYHREVVS